MLNSELDLAALGPRYQAATPFPSICIDDFLRPEIAQEIAASYPSYEEAAKIGGTFNAVNERKKVQVTDPALFPAPLQRLIGFVSSQPFIDQMIALTGIPNLVWDDSFKGGGMHLTASSGLLDVHVDFNRIEELDLYRRVNLLLYLNPTWDEAWGGAVELWDEKVKKCHHRFSPVLNRCVIFSTSEISFHGVTAVQCPPGMARQSLALYYYTREAPEGRLGKDHTTIFRARPDEHMKRYVGMPLDKIRRQGQRVGRAVKKLTGK